MRSTKRKFLRPKALIGFLLISISGFFAFNWPEFSGSLKVDDKTTKFIAQSQRNVIENDIEVSPDGKVQLLKHNELLEDLALQGNANRRQARVRIYLVYLSLIIGSAFLYWDDRSRRKIKDQDQDQEQESKEDK